MVVSAETGLGFVGSEGGANGIRWFELSPAEYSSSRTFTIRLEVGWRRIDATFRLGNFAGDLLSAMAASDEAGRRSFSSVLDSCSDAGADVVLSVNGARRNHRDDTIWAVSWRSFGFSIGKGMLAINEGDVDADTRLVEEWAIRATAAALALMPIEADVDESPEVLGLPEGAKVRIEVNRYERDRRNRAAALAIHGHACMACGVEMAARYGPVADGLIEVHHVVPVSELGGEYVVDPKTDLVPLCPNCHSVAHRRSPPYSLDELRGMLH
ncbi:HNH endonuclease [Burkholderia lata]|nr:HNH endonuclease [Burkholderia lata]